MTEMGARCGHGLLRNSAAIAATSNLAAGLGYLFWTVCTRHFTASEVGVTSTVVSAILVVALLATGGLVPLLIRTLATADLEELSGLCGTAMVLIIVLAGAGGAIASLFLPTSVRAFVGTANLVGILSAGSAGAALLLLVTAMLVGIRRADFALLGNISASLLRLALIVTLLGIGLVSVGIGAGRDSVLAILLVWVASFAASVALSGWLLARAVPGLCFRPGYRWLPRLWRGVGWEHVTTLGAQLPAFFLPVLAAARIPADQVGFLYMALMVGGTFYSVAGATSTALLSDCAGEQERLSAQIYRAMGLTVAVLVVPATLTCVFASELLGLFGVDYSRYGGTLLVLLVVASLPDVVISVGVSVLRLQGRLARAAVLNLAKGAAFLLGSWFTLPHLGIAGAGWSSLAAQSAAMVVVVLAAGYGSYGRATARDAASSGPPRPRLDASLVGVAPIALNRDADDRQR